MEALVQSIVHPTDFSAVSGKAFAHALRIALATKGKLHLLHVARAGEPGTDGFPQVRNVLTQWGFIEGEGLASPIADKLWVLVSNDTIDDDKAVHGILGYLDRHPADRVVLATHGREGIDRLLKGSVAETIFQRSPVPTLTVPA